MATADMMGSVKINGTSGVNGVFGDRLSLVQGARASEGGKRQYYPISSTYVDELNPNRQSYSYDNIPFRREEEYKHILKRLADAKDDAARKRIGTDTGIMRLPLLAASPAFIHPYFFSLDAVHQLYANIASLLHRLLMEDGYLTGKKLETFGYWLEISKATLPATFCGPIRNIHTKLNTSYKLYEWMAVVHWYTVPFLMSLGVPYKVVANYALFVRIAEFSMQVETRSEEDLKGLESIIIEFLTTFEDLYITDPSKISHARLTTFQLIHIPNHIRWFGSFRLCSQATCERTIGYLGRKVRSDKSPFQHLSNIIFEQEVVKCLRLYYPELEPEELTKEWHLQKQHRISQVKQHDGASIWRKHRAALVAFTGKSELESPTRWAKLHLSRGVTLQSELSERNGKTTRSARYFEAFTSRTGTIFGEALAFYTWDHKDTLQTLVAYHPIKDVKVILGCTHQGTLDKKTISIVPAKSVHSLVGVWGYEDYMYVLRKHAGIAVLTPKEMLAETEMQDYGFAVPNGQYNGSQL
ncbi:hypothetical protein BDN71DRAFT_1594821 [Pleurotus eryngii]|uniref:Uncharacterized protein n=1 Tax=Pleurotus eryngii TaxID=5323 RepID=A0A9P5ZGH0_PLEER|nr:hypothetical protein BDN71DRAFT_1594821 [Pleurotus eryngii]